MPNKYYLYQIGDAKDTCYVFSRMNLRVAHTASVKTYREPAPFADGDYRVNGFDPNFKGAASLEIDFEHSIKDESYDELRRIFHRGVHKLFFYSLDDYGYLDKIYYTFADLTSDLGQVETQFNEEGKEIEAYSLTFALLTPYYYEARSARYFDEAGYQNSLVQWGEGYNSIEWGDNTVVWSGTYLNSFPLLSSVAEEKLKTSLTDCRVRNRALKLHYPESFVTSENPDLQESEPILNFNRNLIIPLDKSLSNPGLRHSNYLVRFTFFGQGSYFELLHSNGSSLRVDVGEYINFNVYRALVYNSLTETFYDIRGKVVPYGHLQVSYPTGVPLYFDPIPTRASYHQLAERTLRGNRSSPGNSLEVQVVNTFE